MPETRALATHAPTRRMLVSQTSASKFNLRLKRPQGSLVYIHSSVLLHCLHCLYSEGEKQNLVARLTPYIYRLGFGFEKSNLAHLTFPFNLQRKNSIHKSVAQLIQNPKVIYTSAFIQLRKRIRKLTSQKTHSVARQRTKFDIKAMLVHWNGISDTPWFMISSR